MSEIAFGHARFSKLTEPQQKLLWQWFQNVEGETDGPVNLWVFGERGSGSSYIGACSLHKMIVEHRDWNYECHTATEVMNAMRNFWTLNQQIGPNADDELVREHMLMDDEFRWLWDKAEIIFIDDFQATLDLGFWRKHIHQQLEERAKARKITIVAGSVAPNHPAFADITRVIENHFVVVRGTR
jgi:hypothetical protein